MNPANRILLNRADRYICIWRRAKRCPLAGHSPLYCWITPASMRRLNDLLDSHPEGTRLADFIVMIEQPPASEPVRYLWSEWVKVAA
jgi:hypothetical protein